MEQTTTTTKTPTDTELRLRLEDLIDNVKKISDDEFVELVRADKDLLDFIQSDRCKSKLKDDSFYDCEYLSPFFFAIYFHRFDIAVALIVQLDFFPIEELFYVLYSTHRLNWMCMKFFEFFQVNLETLFLNLPEDRDKFLFVRTIRDESKEDQNLHEMFRRSKLSFEETPMDDKVVERVVAIGKRLRERVNVEVLGMTAVMRVIEDVEAEDLDMLKFLLSDKVKADPNITLSKMCVENEYPSYNFLNYTHPGQEEVVEPEDEENVEENDEEENETEKEEEKHNNDDENQSHKDNLNNLGNQGNDNDDNDEEDKKPKKKLVLCLANALSVAVLKENWRALDYLFNEAPSFRPPTMLELIPLFKRRFCLSLEMSLKLNQYYPQFLRIEETHQSLAKFLLGMQTLDEMLSSGREKYYESKSQRRGIEFLYSFYDREHDPENFARDNEVDEDWEGMQRIPPKRRKDESNLSTYDNEIEYDESEIERNNKIKANNYQILVKRRLEKGLECPLLLGNELRDSDKNSNPRRLGRAKDFGWLRFAICTMNASYGLRGELHDSAQGPYIDRLLPQWDGDERNNSNTEEEKSHSEDPEKKLGSLAPPKTQPTWCYNRYGTSMTNLGNGKYILIGGEHEDGYDPDFCIYNDVIVFDSTKKFSYEIFSYSTNVFPPTDGHSATFVPAESAIYIIGNLGYMKDRVANFCPVYRLDLVTMKIESVATSCESEEANPGWCSHHTAWLDDGGDPRRSDLSASTTILLTGGSTYIGKHDTDRLYKFDLLTKTWKN
jgi:hypothetical protein